MAAKSGPDLTRESSDRRIADLAAAQHGVFTRIQALHLGASERTIRRRVADGRWDRLYAGTFRMAGAVATWQQSVNALRLAWGPGSYASHRCGAAVWSLAGFAQGAVELSVPRARRRTLPGIIHRPMRLPLVDVTTVHAIPVTTAARTLLDVASVVSREVLEEALDDALRRGLASLSRLRWRLEEVGRMGTPGAAAMRELIEARSRSRVVVAQSVFETRLKRILEGAGLPRPALQYEIRDPGGRLVAKVDFAYPAARLAVEAEGYRWHSGRRRFDRDLARRNSLTALGWRVIHVTWSDIQTPESLIAMLASAVGVTPSRRRR